VNRRVAGRDSEMEMSGDDPLSGLETALGYRFSRRELLREALTHASLSETNGQTSLERLEFLGDRVLGLVIAGLLLDHFPHESEGEIAPRHGTLVSHDTLVRVARDISLGNYIEVQPGVVDSTGELPPSILEDALEAVIGAIYRDGGLESARAMIERQWTDLLTATPPRDAKTGLQEWVQARGMPLPEYRTVSSEGPAHLPMFTVEVMVHGMTPERGQGKSKRLAERAAARKLLDRIAGDDDEDDDV
jgi:ribonuclease III